MTTTATITYTAFLGGGSAASVAALMASVPPPPDVLQFYGLRVLSDVTPAASPVVRTIMFALGPSITATATAVLETQDSGSPVESVTVTAQGLGYVAPPVVSFTGGRSLTPTRVVALQGPRRQHQTIPSDPGIPQPINNADDSLDSAAAAVAYLKVAAAAVTAGGAGYSAATFIAVTGQRKHAGDRPSLTQTPNVDVGTVAVLLPTIVGGVITAVTIAATGSGYVGVPTVTVVDPGGGTGAVITVSMGVGKIEILRGGAGYNSPPAVVLTPIFQALFTPGVTPFPSQKAPLRELMTTALEQIIMSPVSASDPVIA